MKKEKTLQISEINVSTKLNTLQGPYEIVGTLQTFGQDIKIDAKLGALGEAQDVALKVQTGDSTISLDGKASLSTLTFKGNLKANADPKLIGNINASDKSSPLASGPFKIEGAVAADQGRNHP